MRLSDKQKEVIKLIRKGWKMGRITHEYVSILSSPKGKFERRIKWSTTRSLAKKGLLSAMFRRGNYTHSWHEYYLTDKAKNIEL